MHVSNKFVCVCVCSIFNFTSCLLRPVSRNSNISFALRLESFEPFDAPPNKYCALKLHKIYNYNFHAHKHSAGAFSTVIGLIYMCNHPRVFSIYCWAFLHEFVLVSSSNWTKSTPHNMQKCMHLHKPMPKQKHCHTIQWMNRIFLCKTSPEPLCALSLLLRHGAVIPARNYILLMVNIVRACCVVMFCFCFRIVLWSKLYAQLCFVCGVCFAIFGSLHSKRQTNLCVCVYVDNETPYNKV